MKRVLLLILLTAMSSAHADETAIRSSLAEHYPKMPINQIDPSPVAGIYEVWAGGKLFYVDEKAEYILVGPLVDVRSKTNLSQKRLEALQTVSFDALPLDKAIKIVNGKGDRKLAIFSDPECPYCKRLEKQLSLLDNLTVYVFMYPLRRIHPQAVARAEAIWCSSDRGQSWRQYMLEGKDPPAEPHCENPIAELIALGDRLGIEGTPTLIFPNGKRTSQALSAAEIERLLPNGS